MLAYPENIENVHIKKDYSLEMCNYYIKCLG